jgi:hypothetical protein
MINTIVAGDSHSWPFQKMCGVGATFYEVNTWLTSRDLGDPNSWCWSSLEPFLKYHTNIGFDRIILTINEVELRAHYWKHIVEAICNNGNTVDSFIKDYAVKCRNNVKNFIKKYNLKRAIIWGPPPASTYNPPWAQEQPYPFVGSGQTRNILYHIFHMHFIEAIKDDDDIGFATAFYDYMQRDYNLNGNDYFVIEGKTYIANRIVPDGIHFYESDEIYGLIHKLILPVISGDKKINMHDSFNTFKNDKFILSSKSVAPTPSVAYISGNTAYVREASNLTYNTWAKKDDIKVKNYEPRSVMFEGNEYHFLKIADKDNWEVIPNFTELCLVPVL